MNSTYYKHTLTEAKEYYNGIIKAKEKATRASKYILNWILGINAFLIYSIYNLPQKENALYIFYTCIIPTLICSYYVYHIFFGTYKTKGQGIHPLAFSALEHKPANHTYINYINVYAEKIKSEEANYNKFIKHYLKLRNAFIILSLIFIIAMLWFI